MEADIIQILRDAGMDAERIGSAEAVFQKGTADSQIHYLRVYRKCLLDELHASQKKLDCLDFLVWKLEKSRNRSGESKASGAAGKNESQ